MSVTARITGEERRASIIKVARNLFVEKGFDGTTTRELAAAAGVSEALLFKHFPSKEVLYRAIVTSSFHDEKTKIVELLRSLKPSTETLVFLVEDLVTHVLADRDDEEGRIFFRLIIRSLMDEGQFTRLAIQGPPQQWVSLVARCLKAAKAAGDMADSGVRPRAAGWFVHQLITGILLHRLPGESVVDYGVSGDQLAGQVTEFCLRGMGLKAEAIRNYGVRLRRRR